MSENLARGSDEDYCSRYPLDGHQFISRSVNAPPIRFVDVCQFCDFISSKRLREQLAIVISTQPQDWAAPARHSGGERSLP